MGCKEEGGRVDERGERQREMIEILCRRNEKVQTGGLRLFCLATNKRSRDVLIKPKARLTTKERSSRVISLQAMMMMCDQMMIEIPFADFSSRVCMITGEDQTRVEDWLSPHQRV